MQATHQAKTMMEMTWKLTFIGKPPHILSIEAKNSQNIISIEKRAKRQEYQRKY